MHLVLMKLGFLELTIQKEMPNGDFQLMLVIKRLQEQMKETFRLQELGMLI